MWLKRDRDSQGIESIVIDDLVGSDDQWRLLITLLESASLAREQRWRVNVGAAADFKEPSWRQLTELAKRYGEVLRGARVAIIVPAGFRWPSDLELPPIDSLSFAVRTFQTVDTADAIAAADEWLKSRSARNREPKAAPS